MWILKIINFLSFFILEKLVNEKQAKHSQLLWNASQSLLLKIKSATSSKSWEEQLRPLEKEISAISKAAGKNKTALELLFVHF